MKRTFLALFILLLVFQYGCTGDIGNYTTDPADDTTTTEGDTTAPTGGAIEINGGDTVTNNLAIELSLNASDASFMIISNSDDFAGKSRETYSASKTWTMSSGNAGTRTVYIKYSDDADNETDIYSDSIYYNGGIPSNALLVDQSNTNGTYNGEAWVTAYNDLDGALSDADLLGNGGTDVYTEIWVSKGTYTSTPYEIKSGIKIYGGFSGNEIDVSSRDYSSNLTILDASENSRVVNGISYSGDAVIDGITMKRGSINGNGGGIYLSDGTLQLINCIVQGNSSTGYGAGIYFEGGYLTLTDTIIQYNFSNGNGGGIYMTAISAASLLHFDSGSINDNITYSGKGGGIYHRAGNIVTGDGWWNGEPNEMFGDYNYYFSVDTSGTCYEGDLSKPAKVYNNDAETRGDQAVIQAYVN